MKAENRSMDGKSLKGGSNQKVFLHINTDDNEFEKNSQIFFIQLCLTCLTICILFGLIFIIPWLFGHYLEYIIIATAIAGILTSLWICSYVVLCIDSPKYIPGLRFFRFIFVKIIFPLMDNTTWFFKSNRAAIKKYFIDINNMLVIRNLPHSSPAKILLLLPHCLQNSACRHRLTFDINNCQNCGQCQVGKLLALAKKSGVSLAIASGGSVARRIVVQDDPQLIIAVACERDLASGIQDCYPLPVIGILNRRPHGPCVDTNIDMNRLEDVLAMVASGQSSPKLPSEVLPRATASSSGAYPGNGGSKTD